MITYTKYKTHFLILLITIMRFSTTGQNQVVFRELINLIHNADSLNINVRLQELTNQINEEKIKDVKYDFLPSFNHLNSNNISSGRYLDPYTNTYNNQSTYFNSLSLNSNLNIYKGGAVKTNLKLCKSVYEFDKINGELTRKSIYNEIAETYFDAAINKEHIILIDSQLVLLNEEIEILKEFISHGKISEYEKLELESKLRATKAEKENSFNKLKLKLFKLSYLTETDSLDTLRGVHHKIIPNIIDSFYNVKSNILYQSKLKNIEISNNLLKMAKATRLPHIYFSSSIITGYSESQKALNTNNILEIVPPVDQLKNNVNNVSLLNLSIPLFSNKDISTRVNIGKINVEKGRLELEGLEKKLQNLFSSRANDQRYSCQSYIRLLADVNDQKEILSKYKDLYFNGKISIENYLRKSQQVLELKKQLVTSKYEYLLTTFIIKNDFFNEF